HEAVDHRVEIGAAQQLHHHVRSPAGELAHVEDPHHVIAAEPRHRPRLAEEALVRPASSSVAGSKILIAHASSRARCFGSTTTPVPPRATMRCTAYLPAITSPTATVGSSMARAGVDYGSGTGHDRAP